MAPGAGNISGKIVHTRNRKRETPLEGATYYTPEITKVEIHWELPLTIHWTTKLQSVGNYE